MTLELVSDTILKANYLEKYLIKTLNSASSERTFFLDQYKLMQAGEYYNYN